MTTIAIPTTVVEQLKAERHAYLADAGHCAQDVDLGFAKVPLGAVDAEYHLWVRHEREQQLGKLTIVKVDFLNVILHAVLNRGYFVGAVDMQSQFGKEHRSAFDHGLQQNREELMGILCRTMTSERIRVYIFVCRVKIQERKAD